MTIKLRPCLALLAVIALAFALVPAWGMFYSHPGVLRALVALLLALAACSVPDWQWQTPPELKEMPEVLLAGTAVLLSSLGVKYAEVFFPAVASALKVMKIASWVGLAVIAAFFFSLVSFRKQGRAFFTVLVLLLFLSGAVVRISAVAASPRPAIDVYNAIRDAPGFVLEGRNPYRADYPWPYSYPQADYDAFPFYPPLPILIALPFRAAGADVRFANVLCDLLAALALLGTGVSRGRPLIGALAAGIYLHFPRVPLMMELAFYEPMLAALLGSGLLLVERGRRLGYFLLGLGLTGKQFGVAMVLPLLKAQRRRALLVGIGLAVVVVLLPFFLWDPKAFLNVIFFAHVHRPLGDDSITLHAGAKYLLGLTLPMWVCRAAAVFLIGWISWRTPATGTASALWIGAALFSFCMLNTMGHYNFFYLCEYLFLLGIAGLSDPEVATAGNRRLSEISVTAQTAANNRP